MENQMPQNSMPARSISQTSSPSHINWLMVLLLIIMGLIIITGSILTGIRIGRNQITESQLSTTTTSSLSIKSLNNSTPSPAIPKSVNVTIPPMPTISQTSVCKSQTALPFPTSKPESKQICQIIELRARDLLQTTYNVHYLLHTIQDGQIYQIGFNKINDLNNNLVDLWITIAGYGLGTEPYINESAHLSIFFSGSANKEAAPSSNYGFSPQYVKAGIPRLYRQFLEKSNFPQSDVTEKDAKFLYLVQPYSNPALYPFKDFFDRAYFSYREDKLLTSTQYKNDLEEIDKWLTSLEKTLEEIPIFLSF